jgi:thioredoxin-like negative regulator of GroEL
VDVQGPEAVAPWVKKYGATFPVAMDSADVFGAAFGLKAIPVSFLVDEVGIVRLQGGGPSKEFRAQVEEILREPVSAVRGHTRESATTLSLDELRARTAHTPDDADARLALVQALERAGDYASALAECEAAGRSRPADASIPFTHGLVLLRQGKTNDALVKLTQARDLDSGNWRIRKQIWALEHPEKFYGTNGIDWNWQKEQIAREKK